MGYAKLRKFLVKSKKSGPFRLEKPAFGLKFRLFRAFGGNELAVEASDIAERNVLGAFSGASSGVGAVTKTEFVHLGNHLASAAHFFHLTLREEGKLADLC